MPSSRGGKVKPADVAADTKRNFIPLVNSQYSESFPPYSVLYAFPLQQLEIPRTLSTRPPFFYVEVTDPVARAIECGWMDTKTSQAQGGPRIRVPFLCAANEKRPGGDWETGCSGYEEKLCRRSNLSATLSTPHPQTGDTGHYPIPSKGVILSDAVVVGRGPHEDYEKLNQWFDLPVVSVPPTRWPKLRDNGTKYSFPTERDLIRDKMRGALRVCLFNGYNRIVIGDFGLGNGHRNPPQEMAELWRDIFLFDPELRGQFVYVAFVFDDHVQSTTRLILDEIAKKESKNVRGRHISSLSRGYNATPTDFAVFEHVFNKHEIDRVLRQPDPRYGLDMITT